MNDGTRTKDDLLPSRLMLEEDSAHYFIITCRHSFHHYLLQCWCLCFVMFCVFGNHIFRLFDLFKFHYRFCLAQGWVRFYCTMFRQPHEDIAVPWRRVPLRHCSSPYCFRFNNAPRWHTCCWQCGHWGSDYHTPACPVRQANALRTLVESQALLETILAQMDELPPVR